MELAGRLHGSFEFVELVTALVMIGLTGSVFVIWRAQAQDPTRWHRWFGQRVWLRAMAWTAGITLAAVAGSLAAGGTEVAIGALAVGLLALYVLFDFWSSSTSGQTRKHFGTPQIPIAIDRTPLSRAAGMLPDRTRTSSGGCSA